MVSGRCTRVRSPTDSRPSRRGRHASRAGILPEALHSSLVRQSCRRSCLGNLGTRRYPARLVTGPRSILVHTARASNAGASAEPLASPWGSGGMADAHGSGPCAREGVRVQLPPSPPDVGAPLRRAGPLRVCRRSASVGDHRIHTNLTFLPQGTSRGTSFGATGAPTCGPLGHGTTHALSVRARASFIPDIQFSLFWERLSTHPFPPGIHHYR